MSKGIRNKARFRGINIESVNVDNYANGVASTHLANMEKHIKNGGLLNWGKRKNSGGSWPSTSNLWFLWN